jgi:hypothetical protein
MARASFATANDNPAAAPSTGIVLLRRLRFEDRLACGTEMTFQGLRENRASGPDSPVASRIAERKTSGVVIDAARSALVGPENKLTIVA